MEAGHLQGAYATPPGDRVRDRLEVPALARAARGLLTGIGGGHVLDLGCGAGLGPLLAGPGLESYTGVDFRSPDLSLPGPLVLHDLRDGLGPVGQRPFDLYLAGFGVASHLAPGELRRLLGDIAHHARQGALVAVEALGLFSLEWPRLWDSRPGAERLLPYALAHDVTIHPWGPDELCGLMSDAGIDPMQVRDRSLQTGPKLDDGRYWPGLPPLRAAVDDLLAGHAPPAALAAALPPLPAGAPAAVHQRLAGLRRELVTTHSGPPADLARAIWSLERGSAGGYGHGLLAIGQVA